MSTAEFSLPIFSYAFGQPVIQGVIRSCPEDFQVDEVLGFEPDGQGEHFLLQIKKRNTNTDWLARQLAKFVDIKPMDVSYAGLKDRNAVTTQWFSVRLPGIVEPDWSVFSTEEYQVLRAERHSRKLRRGSLQGNRFTLIVREIEGDINLLEQRLTEIRQLGVPNYFGEQRFGHDGDNLNMAQLMLVEGKRIKNRHKRSLYLSAARSLLYNLVCSERVKNNSWQTGLNGDAMMLSGSHSFFVAETITDEISQRLIEGDIIPTGPLWGRGELPTSSDCQQLEKGILDRYSDWLTGLEQAGLKQERRALCLRVNDLEWDIERGRITLQFSLPAGSYATSVLREVISY